MHKGAIYVFGCRKGADIAHWLGWNKTANDTRFWTADARIVELQHGQCLKNHAIEPRGLSQRPVDALVSIVFPFLIVIDINPWL